MPSGSAPPSGKSWNRQWKCTIQIDLCHLSSVHTELLVIATVLALTMQKWVDNFAKKWVQYSFLAILANANAQCEKTLRGVRVCGLRGADTSLKVTELPLTYIGMYFLHQSKFIITTWTNYKKYTAIFNF